MSRVVIVLSNLDQGHPDDDSEKLTEHDDDATLTGSHTAVLTCNQYVVYSATFQVPAFYFTLSDTSAALVFICSTSCADCSTDGSVLALHDITKTPLFRRYILEGTEHSKFAVSLPSSSSFPLLSQGDHPTCGTPCWYFHPCETPNAVTEIMKEVQSEGLRDNDRLIKWMEVWFMVLGTAVDMKQ